MFIQSWRISATGGAGIDLLITSLTTHAQVFFGSGEPAFVTRLRHRVALEEVSAALARGTAEKVSGRDDIVAEELRLATRALGRLTGRVDVEELLDVIFRDFCVGK
jgi:tRNA modification GTPase